MTDLDAKIRRCKDLVRIKEELSTLGLDTTGVLAALGSVFEPTGATVSPVNALENADRIILPNNAEIVDLENDSQASTQNNDTARTLELPGEFALPETPTSGPAELIQPESSKRGKKRLSDKRRAFRNYPLTIAYFRGLRKETAIDSGHFPCLKSPYRLSFDENSEKLVVQALDISGTFKGGDLASLPPQGVFTVSRTKFDGSVCFESSSISATSISVVVELHSCKAATDFLKDVRTMYAFKTKLVSRAEWSSAFD
ncbi:hypothetical protein MMC22_002274 [Lobaria immixta]|nr:hypothetical protein [Lobaria immixta]